MEIELTQEQLIERIKSKGDSKDLAKIVASVENSIKFVLEFVKIGQKYCDELKRENKELYDKNINPLLIIEKNIEKELQNSELTNERKEECYTKLFQVYGEIFKVGESYKNSNKRDISNFLKGVLAGVGGTSITGAIVFAIYKTVKK